MDAKTQELFDSIPESVKEAVTGHTTMKMASDATGIEEFTLENVAHHFGVKMASRRAKWRPVAEGLMALQKLRG